MASLNRVDTSVLRAKLRDRNAFNDTQADQILDMLKEVLPSGGAAETSASGVANTPVACGNSNIDDSSPSWNPSNDESWEETKADGSKVALLATPKVE